MSATLLLQPIGTFHSSQSEKYMAPKQSLWGVNGVIELNEGKNLEQACEDLVGFERIWILFWFDRNTNWKPKVLTPRGVKKSIFATRSPHRPNPIGLSCVELLQVQGRKIYVGKNDLLEGTPILDIKPYLNYADAFPESKQGWIEGQEEEIYSVRWSPLALEQAQFIQERGKLNLKEGVELRLQHNPFPFPNHRIKKIDEKTYVLAFKTWRIVYQVNEVVEIQRITSGYDPEVLSGKKKSRWDDVPIHIAFLKYFII